MDETPEIYNAAIIDEVVHHDKEPASMQSIISN